MRLTVQIGFTALTNGYLAGYFKGGIFQGATKYACVPGLNCYSCPGALGSCPLGSLQAVIGSRNYGFSFYVVGILGLFGILLGRFICGWLCPFGLVQDLMYKIPFIKKLKKLPGDSVLKYLKYVLLGGFVILLPMIVTDIIGNGSPWFCKYICPSGTLGAGIPFVVSVGGDIPLGWLFWFKISVLAVILLLSVIVYRPFCRYICPLGAIYGLFNRFALYRYKVDSKKCTTCGACTHACKLGIKTYLTPNSTECIRCGDCIRSCPTGAITSLFSRKEKQNG